MASDTLDLLEEIVKGAESATGKGPGQPLRAQEWNTLAGAVVRLARLAASRERSEDAALAKDFARADHTHLGEVDLTWFEPATRALVEGRGAAGDVAARLDGLARDAKALRGEVAALTAEVTRLRDSLAGAATDDRARDVDLRRVATRLDAMVALDRRVTVLDGRVGGVDQGVREALAFRDTLRDASGAPLDVAGLAARVVTLEGVQDRLRLADGEVVRMRDFENRIAGLEQGVVTDANLDARLTARLDRLATAADSLLVSRAAGAAASALEPRFTALEGGLAGTNTALGTVREAGGADRARLGALEARIAAETVRGDRAAAGLDRLDALTGRVGVVETAAGAAAQRLTALDAVPNELGLLRGQVTAATALAPRIAALESGMGAGATRLAAAETAVATLPDLRARVVQAEAAAGQVAQFDSRLNGVQQGLTALGGQVTVVQSRLAAVDALGQRVAAFEGGIAEITSWRRGVDERLTTLPTRSALETLTARVDTVERRTTDLGTRVTTVERPNIVVRPVR